jgi:hypothetical protein
MDDNVKPKEGRGMYEYSDGSVYDGEWRDGKRHGQGEYEDDHSFYDGEWKDDKQHGKGTYDQKDGVTYVGDFVNNRLEGKGTLTKPDGSIYVGDFVRDEFEGNGNLIRSNGDKYVGEFKKGKLHGNGTYTWMNGDIYTGEHADGFRNGNGTMTYSDGTIKGGIWVKGKFTQEYPKLKVTKSVFNDCDDVFSMDRMVTGDIIVLHNQTVEQYMFDTNTTIGAKENTRNICPYMFLKSNFDEYIKTKNTNPNTREPMTEDNCKPYVLIIVDENAPIVDDHLKHRSRSRSKSKSRSRSRSKTRSMSRGGKHTRRRGKM